MTKTELKKELCNIRQFNYTLAPNVFFNKILQLIDSEAHGHWIKNEYSPFSHYCSECSDDAPSFADGSEYLSKFCPNCGAEMDNAQK